LGTFATAFPTWDGGAWDQAPRRRSRWDDRSCIFEIASPNPDRATEFYRELFDWDVGEERIDGYRLVQTAEGSIGGGLLRTPERVFPYVSV